MPSFHSFILLAEMRTGSNFLEANLNAIDGLSCAGELFNPFFIGYPNTKTQFGFTLEARDADPQAMLEQLRAADGLNGFRFFHDHDIRAFNACIDDPGCAKIILTRNPVESYVSLKIARATGQWKLTQAKHARTEQITFDKSEFLNHLNTLQNFQREILRRLQHSGQTAFYIGYDDLHDVSVLNGLAAWLGARGRLKELDRTLKRQNPQSLSAKVSNPEDMQQALAALDQFDLTRTPNFEPRRGPVVPSYVTPARSPLLYQPIRSGPEAALRKWLRDLDNAPVQEGYTQNSLRQWQRNSDTHRSFTVLRHPVARAHAAFCDKILPAEGGYTKLRTLLTRYHKVSLPEQSDFDHQTAFKAFLTFLGKNLSGQTAIRIDPHWTSQTTVIEGFSAIRAPDLLIRETQLEQGLAMLAAAIGCPAMPPVTAPTDPHQTTLDRIYDGEIEKLTRAAYARDYQTFGFQRWSA